MFQRLAVLAEFQVRVADAAVQVGDDLGPVRDVVVRPVLHRLQRAFRLLQAFLVLPRALRCDQANIGCLYVEQFGLLYISSDVTVLYNGETSADTYCDWWN